MDDKIDEENDLVMQWRHKLIKFTLPEMNLDEKGTKKVTQDKWEWQNIKKSDVKTGHKVKCVLTGEINGITVIDFDDFEQWNDLTNNGIFPEYSDYPHVITKRGIHLYVKYDPEIIQPTKEGKKKLNCDVLNDKKRANYVGTTYKDREGKDFTYAWEFFGELKAIPLKLKNYITRNT